MTVNLFITLLALLATAASLITEGVKTILDENGKNYASNVVVLCVSLVVGVAGTLIAYILYVIPFTIQNVICAILMGFAVWLVAMFGYDKIVQLIRQLNK